MRKLIYAALGGFALRWIQKRWSRQAGSESRRYAKSSPSFARRSDDRNDEFEPRSM